MDRVMKCATNRTCIENYTPGYDYAQSINSTLVQPPFCNGTINGYCTCAAGYCLSHSYKWYSSEEFFYCGPCGRVGSVCEPEGCTGVISECSGSYCSCMENGKFYEAFYCEIPYYGYDIVMQMTIIVCIIIVICFLIVSVYNAFGFTRFQRMENLRAFFGINVGTRDPPPGDNPPKYEDVVIETGDLPTYQEALNLEKNIKSNGSNNEAFESDNCGACATEVGEHACEGACALPPDYYTNNESSDKEEVIRL